MTIRIHFKGRKPSLEAECEDGLSDAEVIAFAEKALPESERRLWIAIYVEKGGSPEPRVILKDSPSL